MLLDIPMLQDTPMPLDTPILLDIIPMLPPLPPSRLRLSPLKLLPLLPLLLPPLSLMLVLLSILMPMLLMLREASSMPRMSSETSTTAIPTSTLPSRRLETPMVESLEDTPMLMLRASCSMLTMLLMLLDSVSLTPDCLLPLSMTELHPPSTLSPWLHLYLMVSHLPLLRTPLRLLRPVLPISLLLRLPKLIGRSVVLMLTPPSLPVTPV